MAVVSIPGNTISIGAQGGGTGAWNGALLDLDFARDRYASSGMLIPLATATTFSRASVADWRDAAGTGFSTQAGNNVLRRDGRGALIEESRTNLFLNSFAPATQVITVANGTTYTVSRGSGAGSVTLSGAMTGTPTDGTPVTAAASSTSLTVTVSGSVGYVNVEAASSALSPISTSGSSATRAADVLTAGLTLGGDFTAVAIAQPAFASIATSQQIFNLGPNVSNVYRLQRFSGLPDRLFFESIVAGSGAGSASTLAGTITAGTRFAVAVKRTGTQVSISIGGGAVANATPSSLPLAPTNLYIGQTGGGFNAWNSFIERVIIFPTAVNDATLQQYSTLATWGG